MSLAEATVSLSTCSAVLSTSLMGTSGFRRTSYAMAHSVASVLSYTWTVSIENFDRIERRSVKDHYWQRHKMCFAPSSTRYAGRSRGTTKRNSPGQGLLANSLQAPRV